MFSSFSSSTTSSSISSSSTGSILLTIAWVRYASGNISKKCWFFLFTYIYWISYLSHSMSFISSKLARQAVEVVPVAFFLTEWVSECHSVTQRHLSLRDFHRHTSPWWNENTWIPDSEICDQRMETQMRFIHRVFLGPGTTLITGLPRIHCQWSKNVWDGYSSRCVSCMLHELHELRELCWYSVRFLGLRDFMSFYKIFCDNQKRSSNFGNHSEKFFSEIEMPWSYIHR